MIFNLVTLGYKAGYNVYRNETDKSCIISIIKQHADKISRLLIIYTRAITECMSIKLYTASAQTTVKF